MSSKKIPLPLPKPNIMTWGNMSACLSNLDDARHMVVGVPYKPNTSCNRGGWIPLKLKSKCLLYNGTAWLVQFHHEYLQSLRLNKYNTGLNHRERKWMGRRNRGLLSWSCSWFLEKKPQNITNLIFMLDNKCFRLDLVTQNPLIANEVILKPVTYILVADIKILIS